MWFIIGLIIFSAVYAHSYAWYIPTTNNKFISAFLDAIETVSMMIILLIALVITFVLTILECIFNRR